MDLPVAEVLVGILILFMLGSFIVFAINLFNNPPPPDDGEDDGGDDGGDDTDNNLTNDLVSDSSNDNPTINENLDNSVTLTEATLAEAHDNMIPLPRGYSQPSNVSKYQCIL